MNPEPTLAWRHRATRAALLHQGTRHPCARRRWTSMHQSVHVCLRTPQIRARKQGPRYRRTSRHWLQTNPPRPGTTFRRCVHQQVYCWCTAGWVSCSSSSAIMLSRRTRHVQAVAACHQTRPLLLSPPTLTARDHGIGRSRRGSRPSATKPGGEQQAVRHASGHRQQFRGARFEV